MKSVAAYGQNIRSCDGDPSLAEVNYVNCINYMNCIGLIKLTLTASSSSSQPPND